MDTHTQQDVWHMSGENTGRPGPLIAHRDNTNITPFALLLAADVFKMPQPARVYYPGCGNDHSCLGYDRIHTVHADKYLTSAETEAFRLAESEVYEKDVHKWGPPGEFDTVLFKNPTGLDLSVVMSRVCLSGIGVVVLMRVSGRAADSLLRHEQWRPAVDVVKTRSDYRIRVHDETIQLPETGLCMETELDESLEILARIFQRTRSDVAGYGDTPGAGGCST